MTKPRAERPSSTYPAEFMILFQQVMNSGKAVTVNTIEPNEKRRYTTFRARLNAFRLAYYHEAVASGDSHRIEMAKSLYGVTIRNPVKDSNGRWSMTIEAKEQEFGDALKKALDPLEVQALEDEPNKGALAIEDLMKDDPDD